MGISLARAAGFLAAWFLAFVIMAMPSISSNLDLNSASARYRAAQDYESLSVVQSALKKGTARSQVEALLGPPDYSPVDGQVFYASDRQDVTREPPATIGLVIDYRDPAGRDVGTIQSMYLGPIGE
jgi:hypothetical protein